MTEKQRYRDLCEAEPSIPLFSRAWWLDAVVGEDGWGVALVENDAGTIQAALPYIMARRYGFLISNQPPLTQTLGPWLRRSNAKYAKRLGQEKDLMQGLIALLPPFDHFSQHWHYSRTNWLPFFWAGFKQTSRYTYRLPELMNEETLWAGLQENIRREIRKSVDRFDVRVRNDLDINDFMALNKQVFARQGLGLPYSTDLVSRIDAACVARGCRRIFVAEDEQGRRHAGVYIVWDENSAYYLMGGGDPELRNSGATSLCMWEAIKFSAGVTHSFDFEGSMIEPVERFFRAFGAVQTPYFSVSRTPSLALAVVQFLRGLKPAKGR